MRTLWELEEGDIDDNDDHKEGDIDDDDKECDIDDIEEEHVRVVEEGGW